MNVEFLKDVALAVAQEQQLEAVMKMIVKGIKERVKPRPAVARDTLSAKSSGRASTTAVPASAPAPSCLSMR